MADVDVVVVGGGISGLAVADGLVRGGLTVRVLEARPRLGGRITSVSVPGGQADLGATWFWPGEQHVIALVDRLGIAVHPQWTAGDTLISSPGRVRRVRWNMGPAFRFSDGADAMINALADQLPTGVVDLDTPVERVEPAGTGVRIHLTDASFSARVAVVALPPSLALGTGIVDRDHLDVDLASIATVIPVWMGAAVKAVAVYSSPFWRAAGLSGGASCPGGPLHEIHDMSGSGGKPAMLFGFGQSRAGHEITAATITAQLAALFGAPAAAPLDVVIRDWRLEEHTSPQHLPPTSRYDLYGSPILQQPTWSGRLHWTSTETSTIAPGHIEGALSAARRTVHTILTNLSSADEDLDARSVGSARSQPRP